MEKKKKQTVKGECGGIKLVKQMTKSEYERLRNSNKKKK